MANALVGLLILLLQAPSTAQTGSLSGRVLSVNGTPAVGVRVAVLEASVADGVAGGTAVLSRIVQTDSEGRYQLDSIPPGRYYIQAGAIDYATYYPGVADLKLASIVTVVAGASIDTLNFLISRDTQNGAIQVVMQRRDTLEPIPGALVTLTRNNSTLSVTVTTDANGSATVRELPPGQYSVRAQAEDPTNLLGITAPVTLTPDRNEQRVVFNLPPLTTITGRIFGPDGAAVLQARVSAMRLRYEDGRLTLGIGGGASSGNGSGEYRITALGPGEYYLRAELQGAGGQGLGVLYYPGVVDPDLATPISIKEGETLTGRDFRASTTRGFTISGTVEVENPLLVYSLMLVPRGANIVDSSQSLLSQRLTPGGTFEISGVPPGQYDFYPLFRGVARTPSNNGPSTGRTPITVRDQDVRGIVSVIRPNAEIRGRVVAQGEGPSFRMESVRVQLRPKEFIPRVLRGTTPAGLVPVDPANGEFTFSDLPEARYNLSVAHPFGNMYVSDIRQGGRSLIADGIVNVGSGPQEAIEVILSAGAATIRASVLTAGQSVSDATVILIPAEPRQLNSLLYKRTTVNSSNSYTLTGIAPGEYEVLGFPWLPFGAEENAPFMTKYQGLGHKVTVGSNETVNVQLDLIADAALTPPTTTSQPFTISTTTPVTLPSLTTTSPPNLTSMKGLEHRWSINGDWTASASDYRSVATYAVDGQRLVKIESSGAIQALAMLRQSHIRLRTARFSPGGEPAMLAFDVGAAARELLAYDLKGNILWSYAGKTNIFDVGAADLDGDGVDEVIVGYNGNTGMHILNSKGQLLSATTAIGNVFYISAGNVVGQPTPQVVGTSSSGRVHLFNANAQSVGEIDPGFPAGVVRVGPSENGQTATIFAAGRSRDAGGNTGTSITLAALLGDGARKWTLSSPAYSANVYSANVSPDGKWLALGIQDGAVIVVDTIKGQIVSSVESQGRFPDVNWVDSGPYPPLLLIANRNSLSAFRILPN